MGNIAECTIITQKPNIFYYFNYNLICFGLFVRWVVDISIR